jgi:hypothetical protein
VRCLRKREREREREREKERDQILIDVEETRYITRYIMKFIRCQTASVMTARNSASDSSDSGFGLFYIAEVHGHRNNEIMTR